MQLVNYYDLLKIESNADLNTIKKAFRREIALYHPDKNTSEGARAHFDLLVEAFDILSHPEKRSAYDALLKSSLTNKPVVIESKKQEEHQERQQKQYEHWKKEAKKKSDSYWITDLTDLLLLDLFLDIGVSGIFSGTEVLLDGIGDSIGDLFDIF